MPPFSAGEIPSAGFVWQWETVVRSKYKGQLEPKGQLGGTRWLSLSVQRAAGAKGSCEGPVGLLSQYKGQLERSFPCVWELIHAALWE